VPRFWLLTTQAACAYMASMMKDIEVRQMLERACEKAGSLRAWARNNSVSAAYVSDVILGNRKPGPTICAALGVEAVAGQTTYRKAK
jgi:hypothetical protein